MSPLLPTTPKLDDLMAEIQQTIEQARLSRTPSPRPHFPASSPGHPLGSPSIINFRPPTQEHPVRKRFVSADARTMSRPSPVASPPLPPMPPISRYMNSASPESVLSSPPTRHRSGSTGTSTSSQRGRPLPMSPQLVSDYAIHSPHTSISSYRSDGTMASFEKPSRPLPTLPTLPPPPTPPAESPVMPPRCSPPVTHTTRPPPRSRTSGSLSPGLAQLAYPDQNGGDSQFNPRGRIVVPPSDPNAPIVAARRDAIHAEPSIAASSDLGQYAAVPGSGLASPLSSPSLHMTRPSQDYTPIHSNSSPMTSAFTSRKHGVASEGRLMPHASITAKSALNMSEDPALKYLQPWLLSHLATFFKDRVRKSVNIKGSIEYPMSFTGRDVVTTIQSGLPTPFNTQRRFALNIARSFQRELFFHEIDWVDNPLRDGVEDVYVFSEDEQRWGIEDDTLPGSSGAIASSSRLIVERMSSGLSQEQNPLPCGVVTALTQCYSPFCTRESKEGKTVGECYSYGCPNRSQAFGLERAGSTLSSISTEANSAPTQMTWDMTVPKELLTQMDKKAIERQCNIFEIISGEHEFIQDLDAFEELFVRPIRRADPVIIPRSQIESFIQTVMSCLFEIRDHNRVLLESMIVRQREQSPIVESIADLILVAALDWGPLYVKWMSDVVFSTATVNAEKAKNPALAKLLSELPKKSARKSDFGHLTTRATVRLQRYPLLLKALRKNTPEGHPDRPAIESAIEVLERQCSDGDKAVSTAQVRVKIQNYHKEIVIHADTPDLDLLNSTRQLFGNGKMTRKPDPSTLGDWTDLYVMLFDHYFVMTKMKRVEGQPVKYTISRRPIPLELLRLGGFNDPPEKKSRLRNITGTLGATLDRGPSDSNGLGGGGGLNVVADDRILYRITIQGLGRHGPPMVLCVESEFLRQDWKKKFEEAVGLRSIVMDSSRIFDLVDMTGEVFAAGFFQGGGPTTNIANIHGVPTCSVPFVAPDGRSLVAVGCADGLWIGIRHDPKSIRQVLHLKGITQCAVLQQFGFILVLAEKVLIAYPLQNLVPSRYGEKFKHGPERLSGNKDVLFFKCGRNGPRTLIIYVKKGGVSQTVFKALEPVGNIDRPRVGLKAGFLGLHVQKSDWFRGYKEFFIPSESYAIQYLRNTISINCARGFEIMSLDSLQTASIPDFSQIRHDVRVHSLQRRCQECRPLGMFRLIENVFLLCYDEFAFFADKHGDPLPDRWDSMIEWEGKPTSVALTRPYVIACSPNLIEIWHTSTSQRCQVIVGSHISCTYDGSPLGDDGIVQLSTPTSQQQGHDEADKRVHVVLKGNDKFHKVFEMVPIPGADGSALQHNGFH